MMLSFIEISSYIILLIFLLISIRIFFVFLLNLKKNKIINKSVSKSVLSGKLSLVIILLFFGISFSLVGGSQLLAKNTERSLEHQYIDNNIYQFELPNNEHIQSGDSNQEREKNIYNFKNVKNPIVEEDFIKPWFIDNTLSWDGVDESNGYERYTDSEGNPFWNIYLNDSSLINTSENHKWHNKENYFSYGWSSDDYETALRSDLIKRFEGSDIENSWGENKEEGANRLVEKMFGNWTGYGKSIALVRIFNDNPSLHPEGKFLYPFKKYSNTDEKYDGLEKEPRDIIKNYDQGLSYKMSAFMNVTPNSADNNLDFEIEILNDIDWLNGKYLFQELSNNEGINVFEKRVNNREINKVSFLNEGKSSEDFIQESKAANPTSDGYSVLVQNDYIEKNPYVKKNGKINFMDLTSFNVYSPVRFNQVTYPAMGLNVLPDESLQTFLGMNYSDYIDFSNTYESYYSSFTNVYESLFMGTEDGYNNLTSLKSWEHNSKSFKNISNDFININENGIRKLINTSPRTQIALEDDLVSYMNDYNSLPSIWAYTGMVEIKGTQKMINIIVIIFMAIVLIVISMLTSKRIKSSGKQIGTLKAMGMKKESIASAYIIYPIIIISLGFVLASILSIPVMFLFTGLMKKYYYITFSCNPLSIWFFIFMLIIPMILAIGTTYLISIKTLNKPTLDLLNNKNLNSPNILVRASGYVTPINTPFAISYMSRGALRAVGKSLLLFMSIFLATLLTGFAMASTTMIKKETESALRYLNFDIFNLDLVKDYGQYEIKPLWVEDDDGNLHKAYEYGEGKEEKIDAPINIDDLNINLLLSELNSLKNPLEEYQKLINKTIESTVGDNDIITYSQADGPKSNYYFTNQFMEEVTFGYIAISIYEKEVGTPIGFNDLTISPYLPSFIKSWSSSLLFNIVYSRDEIDLPSIKDINSWSNIINKYGTDTFIMERFYDQFTHSAMQHSSLFHYDSAINYKYFKGEDEEKVKPIGDFNVANSIDEMVNSFGAIGTSIGEDIKNDWFKDDFKKIDNGENLDYIPVVVSTQAMKRINKDVRSGTIIRDEKNKDQYLISTRSRMTSDSNNWGIQSSGKIYSTHNVLAKIKIVGKPIFSGVDTGINTTKEFYDNYFDNYEDHLFLSKGENIQTDYSKGSILEKDSKNDSYLLHSKSKDNMLNFIYENNYEIIQKTNGKYFNQRHAWTFRLRNSKNLPLKEKFIIDDKSEKIFNHYNLMSTSSILFNDKFFDDITKKNKINNNNYRVGYDELIANETEGDNPGAIKTINDDGVEVPSTVVFSTAINGKNVSVPLKAETLLSQGKAAEQMMISMLTLISSFAVFMAITIIVISVKDIIDSSKREVSMLKAFGYSTKKASTLIMVPYILIIVLAFAISLPLTFLGLSSIALILTSVTGNYFRFTLTIFQSLILASFILGIVLLLLGMSYIAFKKTNALEAIKLTDE